MEKRYQIFISSTYIDLIEERQKVTQAILKLYHFPIGMEMFHADNEEQWQQIKRTIDMSDYYVVIIGRYCGTLIEDEGISYTEKEYGYAISKNIPVLSFVISDDAKKESYGVETARQQRALKKFIKRVKKLPCEFWRNPDELALQVSSTLSIKFHENSRNGWMPFNPYGINCLNISSTYYCGEYDVIYYSELKKRESRMIRSKLIINSDAKAFFYNNVKNTFSDAEYIYQGMCEVQENIIYVSLKNNFSDERVIMYLIKPVGNLNRFLGLLTGLSSNSIPICIKIACFKHELFEQGINLKTIEDILMSDNIIWKNNMMTIEENQKYIFYSDDILK